MLDVAVSISSPSISTSISSPAVSVEVLAPTISPVISALNIPVTITTVNICVDFGGIAAIPLNGMNTYNSDAEAISDGLAVGSWYITGAQHNTHPSSTLKKVENE